MSSLTDSLSDLKDELIAQKQKIETMGGQVVMQHTHPSPSEITSAISTISKSDFSAVTATANDVLTGKTFYPSNGTLTTGTLSAMTASEVANIFMWDVDNPASNTLYYTVPEGIVKLPAHRFANCTNNLVLTLNSDVEEIGECFAGTTDATLSPHITISNFNNLQNVTRLYNYAFEKVRGIDLTSLPSSLTTLGNYALAETFYDNSIIRPGPYLTSLGTYTFAAKTYTNMSQLDLSTATGISNIPNYCFQYLNFNCDFQTPNNITALGTCSFYGGNFNHITISARITKVPTSCFNAPATDTAEQHTCQDVTFLKTTVPTIGTTFLTTKCLRTGFHIYVPDESYEAYYAASALSSYRDYITRISESTD